MAGVFGRLFSVDSKRGADMNLTHLAIALTGFCCGPASAVEAIEYVSTVNLPKGRIAPLNMCGLNFIVSYRVENGRAMWACRTGHLDAFNGRKQCGLGHKR